MGRSTLCLMVAIYICTSSVIPSLGNLCKEEVIETQPKLCPPASQAQDSSNEKGREKFFLPKAHYRFKTIRDLAWFLTPRTYFLTNGNKFIYRAIHESLMGGCTKDEKTLEDMKVYVSYAFGDLTVSAKDKEGKRKFVHLLCNPKSKNVHGLWSVITSKLKQSDKRPLDWPTVEHSIRDLAEINPHIEDSVPEFGRFRCHAHPLCRKSKSDSPFCSAGVDASHLSNAASVLGWTDHISNTTGTGTAFTLLSCINGASSWGTLSTVPQQGIDSIDEFWGVAKNLSFRTDYFARQNYLEP